LPVFSRNLREIHAKTAKKLEDIEGIEGLKGEN
jgi:hypothetical protein